MRLPGRPEHLGVGKQTGRGTDRNRHPPLAQRSGTGHVSRRDPQRDVRANRPLPTHQPPLPSPSGALRLKHKQAPLFVRAFTLYIIIAVLFLSPKEVSVALGRSPVVCPPKADP